MVTIILHLYYKNYQNEVQHHEFKDDQNYNYISEAEIEKTGYLYFDLLKSYVHSLVLKNLNEQVFTKNYTM